MRIFKIIYFYCFFKSTTACSQDSKVRSKVNIHFILCNFSKEFFSIMFRITVVYKKLCLYFGPQLWCEVILYCQSPLKKNVTKTKDRWCYFLFSLLAVVK